MNVLIGANTLGLRRGMQQAQVSIRRFGGIVSGAKAKVLGLTSALAAAAGIGGLTYAIKKAFDAGDALAKSSDSIGIATEKLAGLHLAAKLGGVGIEEMDKSLIRLQVQIGQAVQGFGEGKRAFESIGLSAEDLATLQPEQQLGAVADAMAKLGNNTQRVQIAYDLFGRQGAKLLPVLRGGAKGLEENQKLTERLGLAISRVDAAKLEMANDAVTLMRGKFEGFVLQVAIQLAPVIVSLADRITEFGVAGETAATLIKKAFEGVIKIVAETADVFRDADILALKVQQTLLLGRADSGQAKSNARNWFAGLLANITGETVGGQTPRGLKELSRLGPKTEATKALEARAFAIAQVVVELEKAEPLSTRVQAFFDKLGEDAQNSAEDIADFSKRLREAREAVKALAAEDALRKSLSAASDLLVKKVARQRAELVSSALTGLNARIGDAKSQELGATTVLRGSQEAFRIQQQQRFGGTLKEGPKDLRKLAQESLDEAKRQTKEQEGMRALLQRLIDADGDL